MHTIKELETKHGQLVDQETLEEIKRNYFISRHTQEQMKSRSDMVVEFSPNYMDVKSTKIRINENINKNILAYYNTDGSVNVALNKFNYFVFAYNEERDNWTMVTYKEMSWYGIDIFAKRQMAIDGFARKY